MQNTIELLRMTLQSLMGNKVRTWLSALGIIIGVSTVIAVVEIGLGAQQNDILMQFLFEAIILSIVGGLIGIGIGTGIIPFLEEGFSAVHSVTGVIVGFSFSVFVGIFFGFYPAWKASKLDPVDALRSE